MANQEESDLELEFSAVQSAGLLNLEMVLLQEAEKGHLQIPSTEDMAKHVRYVADAIVENLLRIIGKSNLQSYAYGSLINSYIGQLRDSFRSIVTESTMNGELPDQSKLTKLKYMSSFYLEVLAGLGRAEGGRMEITNILIKISPYTNRHYESADIDGAIESLKRIVDANRLPLEYYLKTVEDSIASSKRTQFEYISYLNSISGHRENSDIIRNEKARLDRSKCVEQALTTYLAELKQSQ